jgi:serine/threonine protein kinase
VLHRGAPDKADLVVVDLGEGALVVKDFASKPWIWRLLGRVQIGREAAAYRRLDGVEGVPKFFGRVDAHAIAIEKIEGHQLAFAPDRFERGGAYVEQLRAIVSRLHARGLVHNDLRGRENVLVRPDGSLVIVDLAAALRLDPGGRLFRVLAAADDAALLKWKALLAPEAFTDEERAFLERFARWRRLWPFNRKRRPGAA